MRAYILPMLLGISLLSCKEGAQGPAGPQGEPGNDVVDVRLLEQTIMANRPYVEVIVEGTAPGWWFHVPPTSLPPLQDVSASGGFMIVASTDSSKYYFSLAGVRTAIATTPPTGNTLTLYY